ncbi:hypothetical protein F4778DRAFT_63585 [Xylariomycetidae sp. FL2044]|nr:hypothetical protein F4778DRAFT_63585 [Xylariomycetidae sp. FL2044]
MHYIRLLRPAKVEVSSPSSSGRRSNPHSSAVVLISLLFTVTTDLGDSFLCPYDAPLDLAVVIDGGGSAVNPVHLELTHGADGKPLRWSAGMRVLAARVRLPPHVRRSQELSCCVTVLPLYRLPALRGVPVRRPGAVRMADLLPARGSAHETGREEFVVPVSVDIVNGVCASLSKRVTQYAPELDYTSGREARTDDVETESIRRMPDLFLSFDEDIGESIARHIWDAGVVTAAWFEEIISPSHPADIGREAIRDILIPPSGGRTDGCLNVLELGCGIGILGLSIAAVLSYHHQFTSTVASGEQDDSQPRYTILLTDVPEAEERARSNITRTQDTITGLSCLNLDHSPRSPLPAEPASEDQSSESDREMGVESETSPEASQVAPAKILYENLDWEGGRQGVFGPEVSSRVWDLVVLSDCTYNVDSLPALVGTLSALHLLNQDRRRRRTTGPEGVNEKSSVLLATKPRHESEKALFGLLDAEGWRYKVATRIPLPGNGGEGGDKEGGGGGEGEVVEVYLLEKGG